MADRSCNALLCSCSHATELDTLTLLPFSGLLNLPLTTSVFNKPTSTCAFAKFLMYHGLFWTSQYSVCGKVLRVWDCLLALL